MKIPDFKNRIRDAVHGFIHVSNDELELIDSSAFQRLRNIKQLALTHYVYPGAMHTRFEHSLGVLELASNAFDFLAYRFQKELKKNFAAASLDLDEAKSILRLAALLHDVGHLPFSHGGEAVLPKGVKHEDVSVFFIENEFSDFLEKRFFKGITKLVSNLIKKEEPIPELRILKQLLSGQLDADRMDYLIRDSLHCGVRYGSFDYKRLVESLLILKSREGGYELAIDRGGIHSLEALLLARYFMFTQIYLHRTRRIYDIYLHQYLNYWNEGQYTDLKNIKFFDDITVTLDLRKDAIEKKDSVKKELAKRIINREHHSMIFETNDHADAADLKKTRTILESIKGKIGDKLNFIIDENAKGTTHKYHVEGDEALGEEFFVIDKFGQNHQITKESKIIQKIPKNLWVIRIYADGKRDDIEKAKKMINQ